jgi:hypothetical protein
LEDLKVVAYDWQPTDLEKMAAFELVKWRLLLALGEH